MASPFIPRSDPMLPYGGADDPRGNVPGYSYPDIYPPTGLNPETVPFDEELAPPGMGAADFNMMINELGETIPAYPHNPIDYSKPHNVGPYEDFPGYDQPGQPPWPSQLDLDNLNQDRIFGIPPNVTQNIPTSREEAARQFLGTPPGFNTLYDLGPFPIRHPGTSMGYA